MRTNILKSIAVAVVLIVSVVNSNVHAGNGFYSNQEVKGEIATSKTIYYYDNELKYHLKYNYTYDENARMISKETLKWNAKNDSWNPCYKLQYSYTENEMIVENNSWNKKTNSYSNKNHRIVYQLNTMNKPVTYITYQWDSKGKDWKIANDSDKMFASQNN